ncbi:hypothetical protein N7490_004455 [Penicillium lividum]|nr:hypothetical protein N7490_004455 [Penicillium lividum]
MAIDSGSEYPRESRCDSEQDRIRDLSRYYCTFDSDPQSTSSPRLSPDSTLTALAQLGVYRFGCNRSFVSIIDGESQHLIAEATASVSLRNEDQHLPNDGIYLGVRTLDLEWGVCPHAIRLFTGQDPSRVKDSENITANRTRNIIRSFTTEDFYKDRPYVLDWPYFRFYAEVPLYSPSGYVLGSYCVVDNKTRTTFGDEEVVALQEIADAISQHLENVRVVHYHHRAENLVKGLTNFVKGHSSDLPDHLDQLAAPETLNFHNLNFTSRAINSNQPDTSASTSKSSNTKSTLDRSSLATKDEVVSLFSENKGSEMTRQTSQPSSLAPGSPESAELLNECFDPEAATDEVPIAERVAAIFSRASDLLRGSMDLDGVAFLDARQGDSNFDLSDDFGNGQSPNFADSRPVINPEPWALGNPAEKTPDNKESLCRPLDCLTTDPLIPGSVLTLSEDFLRTLIQNFPSGHIFNLDNEPCEPQTLEQKASSHLAAKLPGAKSVLFIPLWDWNKSHWLAGTLVWTRQSCRPLGMEELHYFKVFGDSIISEVSRVHWSATERSKFDFVSSINHELRSPLHGILGSAELLQTMPLQPSQQEMVKMIDTSGLALLNTIDHLLEYCRINDLATGGLLDKNRPEREMASQESHFDLGTLVEEVATAVCADKNTRFVSALANESKAGSEVAAGSQNDSRNEVSVVLRVDQPGLWAVRSAASAWRGILLNLIGNSMKWTEKGLIEITLSKMTPDATNKPCLAHLCVKDTGSGISRDYLKNRLFSPFAKEDSLSPGVGLGLSIIRKFVRSLDGEIDVRSEVGAGTQVDIRIPVKYPRKPPSANVEDMPSLLATSTLSTPIRACLIGLHGQPEMDDIPSGILTVDAKRKLSIQNALFDVFMSQLGWVLTSAKFPRQEHGDVAIIEGADLHVMLANGLLATDCEDVSKFFIVLDGKTSPLTDELPPNFIRVSQPFGPRSLHDAAARFIQIFKMPLALATTELAPIIPYTTLQNLDLQLQQSSKDTSATLASGCETTIANPPEQADISEPQTEDQSKPANVLIVDDNPINLKIMSTFVRKFGCRFETALNGLIALEKYEAADQPYDFVLMDISMPVMDGLEATTRIRAHEIENDLKPSCIIAITAVASSDIQDAAFKAGVNDYLIKPLSLDKLRELIRV